ncbi:Ureidoglycolate lyase [compost metagenome]
MDRYSDLAEVDTLANAGRPGLSMFVARPCTLPLAVRQLERHPLSSQAFIPLGDTPFLIVVAPPGCDRPQASDIQAFLSNGQQGINYRRGTWHHGLLALTRTSNFVVVDRLGSSPNCDVHDFSLEETITVSMSAADGGV